MIQNKEPASVAVGMGNVKELYKSIRKFILLKKKKKADIPTKAAVLRQQLAWCW